MIWLNIPQPAYKSELETEKKLDLAAHKVVAFANEFRCFAKYTGDSGGTTR